MTDASVLLLALVSCSLVLTYLMFTTRNMMLGFPAGLFWALVGGHTYGLSTDVWDIYYDFFFASMGMTIFCLLGMFALRNRDIEPRDSDWADSGKFVDEEPEPNVELEMSTGERSQPSRRTTELRQRAARRRTKGVQKRTNYGEFS